jgi:lysozyme
MLDRIGQVFQRVLGRIFPPPAEHPAGFSEGDVKLDDFWARVDDLLDGVPADLDEEPKVVEPRRISAEGKALLMRLEGLELEAYPDPESELGRACRARNLMMRSYRKVPGWEKMGGAPWTIGWGHTGPEVVQGYRITREQAEALLDARLANEFEPAVRDSVSVPLTDGQFSALVCLCYNIGATAFRKSTLLRKLNAGDYDGAYEQFDVWLSGGVLQDRRDLEQMMFDPSRDAKANG